VAATQLAAKGAKVLVLEKYVIPGGFRGIILGMDSSLMLVLLSCLVSCLVLQAPGIILGIRF
jgi:ribulose 1,5-bisphosphate synthetase/thiazole synthase